MYIDPSHMNEQKKYYQIRVTWDEKLLKRRGSPQSVSITTKDFFSKYYPRLYDWDWENYFSGRDDFYKRIPSPLTGKLWYKGPIDFMEACYIRGGMVACVSEKVKKIFEELGVNKNEYILHPISIQKEDGTFYILFVPFLSIQELGIDYRYSTFETRDEDVFLFSGDKMLNDYLSNHENTLLATKLVLNPPIKDKDIINAGYIHGGIYFSDRIIKAFDHYNVIGYEVSNPRRMHYGPLSFSDSLDSNP